MKIAYNKGPKGRFEPNIEALLAATVMAPILFLMLYAGSASEADPNQAPAQKMFRSGPHAGLPAAMEKDAFTEKRARARKLAGAVVAGKEDKPIEDKPIENKVQERKLATGPVPPIANPGGCGPPPPCFADVLLFAGMDGNPADVLAAWETTNGNSEVDNDHGFCGAPALKVDTGATVEQSRSGLDIPIAVGEKIFARFAFWVPTGSSITIDIDYSIQTKTSIGNLVNLPSPPESATLTGNDAWQATQIELTTISSEFTAITGGSLKLEIQPLDFDPPFGQVFLDDLGIHKACV